MPRNARVRSGSDDSSGISDDDPSSESGDVITPLPRLPPSERGAGVGSDDDGGANGDDDGGANGGRIGSGGTNVFRSVADIEAVAKTADWAAIARSGSVKRMLRRASRSSAHLEEVKRALRERPLPGKRRLVRINDRATNRAGNFATNEISTSKYTLANFLPKNLFEQFRRIANFYFLVIVILQVIPNLSPVSPWTSVLPLVFVLSVTALKEAIEDASRHRSDRELNHKKVLVLNEHGFVPRNWADIEVGDVVKVMHDEFAPADIVVLSTSGDGGNFYVETSNLDGETNLKVRTAVDWTAQINSVAQIDRVRGEIETEPPNRYLYRYRGTIKFDGSDEVHPLTVKQVMLRGCVLKTTTWVFGIVIYTGRDTKVMMNGRATPSKRSSLEKSMNRYIGGIFGFLGLLCIGSAAAAAFYEGRVVPNMPYLGGSNMAAGEGARQFFTFVILYNVLIPISLYVSVEVVKLAQVYLLHWDLEMFDPVHQDHARARTSNLNEELGQVETVFTDKTGTLTRNEMEFLKCTIAGVSYGQGTTEVGRAAARRRGEVLPPEPAPDPVDPKWRFRDDRFLGDLHSAKHGVMIREFLIVLAVCHTILPQVDRKTGHIEYMSASPDEATLLDAAHHFGYVLKQRTNQSVILDVHGEEEVYEILDVLEFTSKRARMSVIVRNPAGDVMLYCKGADSVIFPRLRRNAVDYEEATLRHLESFAADGLRTLVIATTRLADDTFEQWHKVYHAARTDVNDREARINEACELIERELVLVGATAIEDKLQDGVPDCIESLRLANIDIWMLTGDKQETAVNIGFAAALLDTNMNILILNADDAGATQKKINDLISNYSPRLTPNRRANALVVDGATLDCALEDARTRVRLLALTDVCKVVICCRASPLQKAQVVDLVRTQRKKITLAIGDGANDVSMITMAHVGVGISGNEGRQAFNSADYGVTQFRFLRDLLLVHGRWNYSRIAFLVLYSFYKNFAFAIIQFWFQLYCGFSGQTLMDSWYIATYNTVWTAGPVMMLSFFEQKTSRRSSIIFPELYFKGQTWELFNFRVFSVYLMEGLYHSALLFFIPVLVMGDGVLSPSGRTYDIWTLGTIAYTCAIVLVTIKLAFMTHHWTVYNHLFTWGSIVGYLACLSLYHLINATDVSNIIFRLYGTPSFYLTVLVITALGIVPRQTFHFVRRTWWPSPDDIVMEMEDSRFPPFHRTRQPNEHKPIEIILPANVESEPSSPTGYHPPDFPTDPTSVAPTVLDESSDGGVRTVELDEHGRRVRRIRALVHVIGTIKLLRDTGIEETFRGFHFAHEAGHADLIMGDDELVMMDSDLSSLEEENEHDEVLRMARRLIRPEFVPGLT